MGFDTDDSVSDYPDFMEYYDPTNEDGFDPRTIAIIYNASTLVSVTTIVIGVFFAITAVALIIYYLSTLGGGSPTIGRRRSYEHIEEEEERIDTTAAWLRIITSLEEAYALYGMAEADDACRRRLVCEVYMPGAISVNEEAALRFSKPIGQLVPNLTSPLSGSPLLVTTALLGAANVGRGTGDCAVYQCDAYSLGTIVARQQDNESNDL